MAKLMLIGNVANIDITQDEDAEAWRTSCVQHRNVPLCDWSELYDDLHDATEYAGDHADRGTR